MNKPTKKRAIEFRKPVLEVLAKNYGYSIDYIRKCIRGDRDSETADLIRNEYRRLSKKYDDLEVNTVNKLNQEFKKC